MWLVCDRSSLRANPSQPLSLGVSTDPVDCSPGQPWFSPWQQCGEGEHTSQKTLFLLLPHLVVIFQTGSFSKGLELCPIPFPPTFPQQPGSLGEGSFLFFR